MRDTGAELQFVVLPPPPVVFWDGPTRRFHPAWLYCQILNDSEEPIFVYGPRHESDAAKIPTSLYILPARTCSPRSWDCKGVLVPSGCVALVQDQEVQGPAALKYRDLRRVGIQAKDGVYHCPPPNGILLGDQIDFPVPSMTYEGLLACPRRLVQLR